MSKNILVTGGTGFIGHHLINELIKEKENKVFVIDNLSFGKRKYIKSKNDQIKLFHVSLTEKEKISKIIEKIKPEKVFHLGALHYIPYCLDNPEETFNVNVFGTYILLEILLHYKPKFIFFSSTAAVYKPDENKHSEENSLLEPIDIYGKTKLIGEILFHRYFLSTKVPTVIGRFFNVYGPEETNPHLIPSILEQICSKKKVIKIGNLFPKRDYIYVDDVVDAVIRCSQKIKRGFHIFNIGTGRSYSVQNIIKIIKKYYPEIIFKEEEKRKRSSNIERKDLCADIDKIKKQVGWKPRYDFEKGYQKLISYL